MLNPQDKGPVIVVFAYNRPEHLQQTLEALQSNVGFERHPLRILIDGPKSESDEVKVSLVRVVAEKFKQTKKDVAVHISTENSGLAASVINGLDRIFGVYESAMIFEDDIVSHPQTIEFLSRALQIYKNTHRVFAISGYTVNSKQLDVPEGYPYDSFFSHRGSSWGWATWRRSWDKVRWDYDYVEGLLESSVRSAEFRKGGADLGKMLQSQRDGKVDSWAIRFQYSMFREGGVCLFPLVSLVRNIGFDSEGTHTHFRHFEENGLNAVRREFSFPEEVFVCDALVKSQVKNNRTGLLNIAWKICSRLSAEIRSFRI